MCNHVECALFCSLMVSVVVVPKTKIQNGAGYKILADNLLAFKKIGKAYHRGSDFLLQTHVSLSHCVASMSGKG